MYHIEKQGDNLFQLFKDNALLGEFLTLEDAQKAKEIAESVKPSGTWVNDGAGLEYPEGTDDYHSGDFEEKKLTGEDRIDALCNYLRDSHGIHVPYEIAPKE